jgi:CHASE3 domain sensor protein
VSRLRARLARRLASTSVGTLLAATIGVVLMLAVLGIGLALIANRELDRERSLLLDQVGPSVRAALQLESALVNEETGVRGYVLTREQPFLQPYHD